MCAIVNYKFQAQISIERILSHGFMYVHIGYVLVNRMLLQ